MRASGTRRRWNDESGLVQSLTWHPQFLIATHSPILLAYPGATLYQFEQDGIREVAYRDTDHYLVTRAFLNDPERALQYLFAEDDEDADA